MLWNKVHLVRMMANVSMNWEGITASAPQTTAAQTALNWVKVKLLALQCDQIYGVIFAVDNSEGPIIFNDPEDIEAVLLEMIHIDCEAQGNPKPVYSWYKVMSVHQKCSYIHFT